MIVTRFAPSPNGALHLGHAYAAVAAHDLADGGRFVLRIEDIDGERSRSALAGAFREDLAWLGLAWDEVPPQSARITSYTAAAEHLRADGLLYPCICTRAQILAAAPGNGRDGGTDGPIYPGTCRGRAVEVGQRAAWRLDVAEAMRRTGPLVWHDQLAGPQPARPDLAGDVVLVRKDAATPASYHLAAMLDDAADGITVVTRGADLFAASHVHRLLQELLGLPVPAWHHHPLLLDEAGRKLAKRRGSPSLADRRRAGEDGRDLADRLRAGELPAGICLSTGVNAQP